MGSFTSSHTSESSLDTLNAPSSKGRRSKRLMEKFRSRQSSRADLLSTIDAIDPVKLQHDAHNRRDGGEMPDKDHQATSADADQITLTMRDDDEESAIDNNNIACTPPKSKPVCDEDRHVTYTGEQHVETESTKHNADKAVSCNSTATIETPRPDDVRPQVRENSNGEGFQVLIETESWRTAKNWKSDSCSSEIRSDRGISSRGHVIVIREAPTTSSSESNFTDPESQHYYEDQDEFFNLTVTKLESLSLVNNQATLCYEPISINNDEMPIVKTASVEAADNGGDKGIFSVSRVKKVELSELPLNTTDMCSTPPSEQQSTVPGSGKTTNGNSVLHRVITLTTASHSDSNQAGKTPPRPAFVPEKLHFSAYEKFEGQMLMNWFAQSLQSVASSITATLGDNDLTALTLQYCTNLLVAGVIRQLDAPQDNVDSFKPNSMYQWTHKEQQKTISPPGKLETTVVWPHASDKKTSPKSREGESKIPKLLASTPKARIQLVSSLITMTDHSPVTNSANGTESEHSKVNELKAKVAKCETIQEMFLLIKSFLSEYSMQSSESSSNSGIFTGSMLNGTDSTIFDRSVETTIFNVNSHRQAESPATPKVQLTPKGRSVKSRTSPSTPTGLSSRTDPKKFRRNLSVDSVNAASPTKTNETVNGAGCKRCLQMLTSPKKIGAKRMVDKATVMEVEPIVFPPPAETKSIETQTEPEVDEIKAIKKEEAPSAAAPLPPPPPPMMNAPPPPPMPGLNAVKSPGPPPPPFPGSSMPNLPPPPPFGLSSPMPFPPPIAQNTGPALRKKAVNPPLSMKPLHWTRIVAPIKSFDTPDGPTPASLTPDEKKDDEEEELWKEIDEIKLDNIDEFTELFSRPELIPKSKAATPLPKVKAIKVLDSKRSQNIGIFVRSIHVDFAEIEYAIYHCDTSVVSLETLQHIMEIKATNEELMMIKEAAASHAEGSPPLDTPENFLLRISQVSSFAERISCIVFQAEFDEQCTMVSRKLLTVKNLCEFLLENDGLKEVFSIILTLGNFMNGGNRQRGQADGFGLEILGKLKDTKSKDPKITLLHFIVKTYIERCRKNGCAIHDLVLPTPDPNDVDKSLSFDFEECKKQLNALKTKVEECKKTSEKVVAASAEDCVEPFKQQMESFIEMAIKKIDSRFQKLDECQVVFIKTMKFYHFTPKKGTLEQTPPAQFFEYWTSFSVDFNGIFKKELVILTNELLKKTRQVTKPQSRPTSGENNLKARINRLKSRNN